VTMDNCAAVVYSHSMTWLKGHPRATLAIAVGAVAAAQAAILLGEYGFTTMMLLALGPYAVLAIINGWVLHLRGRSRHWLWLYVFYNWGGALVPVAIALFAPLSQQSVDDHVRSLGA
jgi:hypothetical protein